MEEFKVNKFITVKFEEDNTIIYVNNKRFIQCKSLLYNIPVGEIVRLEKFNSVDELTDRMQKSV